LKLKQQIVDETVAKQNAMNEKQRLIDRGLTSLQARKEQSELKENTWYFISEHHGIINQTGDRVTDYPTKSKRIWNTK
jgi:hypothetical protein